VAIKLNSPEFKFACVTPCLVGYFEGPSACAVFAQVAGTAKYPAVVVTGAGKVAAVFFGQNTCCSRGADEFHSEVAMIGVAGTECDFYKFNTHAAIDDDAVADASAIVVKRITGHPL